MGLPPYPWSTTLFHSVISGTSIHSARFPRTHDTTRCIIDFYIKRSQAKHGQRSHPWMDQGKGQERRGWGIDRDVMSLGALIPAVRFPRTHGTTRCIINFYIKRSQAKHGQRSHHWMDQGKGRVRDGLRCRLDFYIKRSQVKPSIKNWLRTTLFHSSDTQGTIH